MLDTPNDSESPGLKYKRLAFIDQGSGGTALHTTIVIAFLIAYTALNHLAKPLIQSDNKRNLRGGRHTALPLGNPVRQGWFDM